MKEFLLCVTSGCLLIWVVYLKLEINELQQQQKKLISILGRYIKDSTGDIEVSQVLKWWGKKAQLESVDTSWVQKRAGK
jgi:hypothetical protein